jgi:hypothetical protein
VGQFVNGTEKRSEDSAATDAPTEGAPFDVLHRFTRNLEPRGYITTNFLAALWDERSRLVEQQRQVEPDDLKELESRQRLATQALQAYRFLAELEQQLGFEVALPVLGPWRGPSIGQTEVPDIAVS